MTNGGPYKPRKLLDLKCKVCGGDFQATRPDARYCNPTCRKKISRAAKGIAAMTLKRNTKARN